MSKIVLLQNGNTKMKVAPILANRQDLSSTFNHNLSLPVHRWFRFSAGYSAAWCQELIQKEKTNGRMRVLDPFVGSGTTVIASESIGLDSIGVESHPFIVRIARAKQKWDSDIIKFSELSYKILNEAEKNPANNIENYPAIVRKCFPDKTLIRLHSLKTAFDKFKSSSPASELVWLALASILRTTSPVGTAQWQYILPKKTKIAKDPFIAFIAKVEMIRSDMFRYQDMYDKSKIKSQILQEDARNLKSVPDGWAQLVITSPPYANNYDYADAMRLEMSFFHEINSWGDLQDTVRKYLIRSCTQHVGKLSDTIDIIINDPILGAIKGELKEVCDKLSKERNSHGGKKSYHVMIAYYFKDLAEVWHALRRASSQGALICFVIGDSAPYGVHVPVERWLGELAISAGFKSFHFEKLRDRNTKWKNRKHRVPLQEGRLWVQG